MMSRELLETALHGGKPERAPIFPVFDQGYIYKLSGKNPSARSTADISEKIRVAENAILRHPSDGVYVHMISPPLEPLVSSEEFEDYVLVKDPKTGVAFRLLSDGTKRSMDGSPLPKDTSDRQLVQSRADIDAVIPRNTEDEIDRSGCFGAVEYIAHKYPDRMCAFQVHSPMVTALNSCGGYVNFLLTMASDRELFWHILRRWTDNQKLLVSVGKKTGAQAVWFTSYYTGADTISPKDYEELVFPFEKEICECAKNAGLYVLDWYLGDLMPNLHVVNSLPIDALVLEQGRKGYDLDPVAIRRIVGPERCIFGYATELDLSGFNRESLRVELLRQFEGAGKDGAFVVGTTIVPPDADPEAVDYYFSLARELCQY